MDERRHNMDGALFVDEEAGGSPRARNDERPVRARSSSYDDDGKAEAARRVTQGILDRMDLEASVHVRENDEQVVLDIDGPDAGRAIGKKGMTLEALQFLVNKIVNRDPDERRHIVLDSGDYRERHDNGLISMAKREAKRAVTSGRAVTLEPMSARDRRVIHVSLAKFAGISTRSEGEGMERRLQIIPARGSERGGERARDDRPRSSSDRPRAPARDDRRGPPRERPAPVERDRAFSSDRAPRISERDRSAPVERERAPIDRERAQSSDRDRDRVAPIDRDRPVQREQLTERERLTERDRPVERSRVAEPRREREPSRSFDAPSDRDAPRSDDRPAPRRDYDDRGPRNR